MIDTVAEPVLSPDAAVHSESRRVAMVYVVFDVGVTLTTIGLDDPLNVVPSESVPLHGPVPVTAIERFADAPSQIDCVPEMAPVGLE